MKCCRISFDEIVKILEKYIKMNILNLIILAIGLYFVTKAFKASARLKFNYKLAGQPKTYGLI